MKKYINILIYISFFFLIFYLFKIDFLQLKTLTISWLYCIIALLLLFAGFILSGLGWWNALRIHKIKINKWFALSSHGLPVFTKYIPGKIWTIIGRAGIIAKRNNLSIAETSYISLKEQLIYMWTGLLISVVPILIHFGFGTITLLLIFIFIGISLFLFNKNLHNLTIRLVGRLIQREITIPFVTFQESVSIQFYCLIYWIFWMCGYYFLVISVYPDIPFQVVFIFPLSVVFGLLAIIIPGGLGVREGLMVAYFSFLHIPVDVATTIALLARLWFVIGEIFIFLLGLYLKSIIIKAGKS